jgi:hypothetical protein
MHASLSPPLMFLSHLPRFLSLLPVAPHLLPVALQLLADALPHLTAVATAAGLPEVDAAATRVAVRGGGALAVKTLPEVIDGLKTWVMGILAAVATLFLVIGGLRYMTAAGDPAAVEQAKGSLKAALTGYALAVLAPVILQVLQGILGA